MNLHKNAKTCPKSRALIVSRVLQEHRSVICVAAEFGVSRRTVYQWIRRYRESGAAALQDASCGPRVVRHRLDQDWVDLIVELRTGYRMTAICTAQQLRLSRSTVSGVPGTYPRRQGWEYVHVCIDDYSRVAYAEVLPNERKETAVAFLKRAVRWFGRFGITIKRVLTDNGPCNKSTLWATTCQVLRIKVKKTRPYRPQTNGKAERFIRTLKEEWAYARVYLTSNERQAVLPIYLRHYNEHRAHSSVNSKPPITRMPGVNNVRGIHN